MGNCAGKDIGCSDFSDTLECGENVCYITNKESWDEKISEANKECKIVVANFSATWCVPCKVIAPWYAKLAVMYPSFVFLTIDVDEIPEFSTSMDIKATPTFFLLKNGRQLDKVLGANKPEVEKKLAFFANTSA